MKPRRDRRDASFDAKHAKSAALHQQEPPGGQNNSPALSAAAGFLVPRRQKGRQLKSAERRCLVEQALILLDGFYVHLPQKRAMFVPSIPFNG